MCTVRTICIGTLSNENIWFQRRKIEKLLEDKEHIVCFFVHYCYGKQENKKGKAGKRRNDSGSSEEDVEESSYNYPDWPEYSISSFAYHAIREFLTAEFDLIPCKAIRSRSRLAILYLIIINTVTSVVCSVAIYFPFIQVISTF